MSSLERRPHVLKREKTVAMPRHIICFDTETKPIEKDDGRTEHKLKLGWACYLRRRGGEEKGVEDWLFFTHHVDFWHFVLSHAARKNRLWVLAHNISFDFTVMNGWEVLKDEGFKLQFFHSSGKTTIIKVKGKGRSIVFVDTLNWFPESLEKLGERLGVPKMKIDFKTASFSYLKRYCKRDVQITVETVRSLIRFLESNRIARLSFTIASTAMAAYLLSFYKHKIYIHNNRQAIDLERQSYRGGRTECFFIGELSNGPFTVLDVNSLYPYVMKENAFPCRYRHLLHSPAITEIIRLLKTKSLTAECFLDTPDPVYAVKRERTMFPIGRFWVTLTTPEIAYALKHNHLKSVGDVVVYDRAPLFASYVDGIYKLRQSFKADGQPMYEHFCKILLNSLYGKFGQKGEKWTLIGDASDEPDRIEDCIDAVTHRRKRLRYLLGQVWELTGHDETLHSFPAIAAHVTAFARLHLWRLMQVAGCENVFYCDTDSLFVNPIGCRRLREYVDPIALGMLKEEYQTDTLTIYGLKDYVTATKQVTKGIRRNAIRVDDRTYRQETWPTLRGLLSRQKANTYATIITTKTLNRNYTKGVVMPSGVVVPPVLDEPVGRL